MSKCANKSDSTSVVRFDPSHQSPEAAHHGTDAGQSTHGDDAQPQPVPFAWRDLKRSTQALAIEIRLGSSRISVDQQQQLSAGTVVALDNGVDEPVEIVVGGEVLGYGRVVTVDGKLAIQISELRQSVQRRMT